MVCIDTSREKVLRNVTLPKKSRTKTKRYVSFYKLKVYNCWKRHSSNTLRTNSVSTHLFRQNPARNIPSKSHVSETCKAKQKRKKRKRNQAECKRQNPRQNTTERNDAKTKKRGRLRVALLPSADRFTSAINDHPPHDSRKKHYRNRRKIKGQNIPFRRRTPSRPYPD